MSIAINTKTILIRENRSSHDNAADTLQELTANQDVVMAYYDSRRQVVVSVYRDWDPASINVDDLQSGRVRLGRIPIQH